MIDEAVHPLDVRPHPCAERGPRQSGRRHAAAQHVDTRVALEPLRLQPQPLGVRHVVGVQPRHERGTRVGQRQAERVHQPARRRPDHADAAVERRPRAQVRAAAVARAVVHGDELVVRERLRGERVEAGGKRRECVANRQQHRDAGRSHRARAPR